MLVTPLTLLSGVAVREALRAPPSDALPFAAVPGLTIKAELGSTGAHHLHLSAWCAAGGGLGRGVRRSHARGLIITQEQRQEEERALAAEA